MTMSKLILERVRIDGNGYDASGAYWGVGPDVFIGRSADGSDEITVRARNAKDARIKMAAEYTRAPGANPTEPVHLGGNAPRKTRYESTWRHASMKDDVTIRITHARDYLSSGSDHIEIESIKPAKAPLPMTETGYRSHFMPALDLMNAGGPVAFVQDWLTREAAGKSWRKTSQVDRQGDLFQWARANDECSKPTRKRTPTARRHDGTPPRRKPSTNSNPKPNP